MSHVLDGIDTEYCDNIADIIWTHTLDGDGDTLTEKAFHTMKAELLDYFRDLENKGLVKRGKGFEFIQFLNKQFGDLATDPVEVLNQLP